MPKIRDFNVDFWKNSGGIALDPHTGKGEGGYGAPPQIPPLRGHLDSQALWAPQYLNRLMVTPRIR